MARARISVRLHIGRALEAIEAAEWSDDQLEKFNAEWAALEAAGAPMIDVQIIDGEVVAHPSEDFTRHMAAHGLTLW